jgi:uncharacterized protein (TIGR03118 family)
MPNSPNFIQGEFPMQRWFTRTLSFSALLGFALVLISSSALAQYKTIYLVSNVSGKALHTDPLLQNAWGLAYGPGNAFWVSDEASGWSTLYDGQGNPQSLQVVVPPATGAGAGSPTGLVYNASTEFAIDGWPSLFIFATLDGTIQGWSPFNAGGTATLIAVTSSGASYTGLAITNYSSNNYIYAADANNNKVDVYDGSFNLVNSFTDSSVPAGFAPFGIQDIAGRVYVSYAATNGGPGGYIDVFSESGTLERHLAHGSPLNQPWGFAIAPPNFGPFSKALLVTNNATVGTITGYDVNTGKLMGNMMNSAGKPISINGIWGIEFGGGTSADGGKDQLFFTAGPNDTAGYFGMIGVE